MQGIEMYSRSHEKRKENKSISSSTVTIFDGDMTAVKPLEGEKYI